jgi:hypothetical protein
MTQRGSGEPWQEVKAYTESNTTERERKRVLIRGETQLAWALAGETHREWSRKNNSTQGFKQFIILFLFQGKLKRIKILCTPVDEEHRDVRGGGISEPKYRVQLPTGCTWERLEVLHLPVHASRHLLQPGGVPRYIHHLQQPPQLICNV